MNVFKTIRVNYVVNYCQFLTKIRCATLATKILKNLVVYLFFNS